ncbi:alpha/beta-hydrolase [Penicillium angulare]|uniref:alpha/beta-hydrolase n=1 Tax=Penicillium angulare TaxID=116970 RepID=UPI0025400BE9|nr:alpha/beta-hydrolase [Penicillium angulare]KAJ5272933.1 alpha/beta-hydrolase [Penicillium angulare]
MVSKLLLQTSASQVITLPDGREIGYATYGPPPSSEIPTIVYCHGFPGSRFEAAFIENKGIAVHTVAIDRPGMGLSTFQPSRRIIDWPADVLAVLDHLNISQFYVIGDSGGSAYALACAKEIPPHRLLRTSVVAGLYPLTLGTQGMSIPAKVLMTAANWLPSSVMAKLLGWEFGTVVWNEDQEAAEEKFMKVMEGKAKEDVKCLDDLEFRYIVIESMKEAFKQGSQGPAWDLGLYGDWGFKLKELNGKRIDLWHGKKDVNAPFLMAEKAAAVLEGCDFHGLEEESHLSLPYNCIDSILENLVQQ